MMRRPGNSLILGGAIAAAAAVFLGSALVRAVTVEPVAPPAPEDVAALDGGVETAPEDGGRVRDESSSPSSAHRVEAAMAAPITQRPELALSMDALRLAVDSDPFQPDRNRHPDRYLLPGERMEDVPVPELPPTPPFRVVGTAMSPAGALALVQVEDRPPRVLALGESLLGYVLERVDGEFATMTGSQRSVTLPVSKMVLAEAEPEGRGRGARGRNSREQRGNDLERAREEQRSRQQEIMQMLREQIRQRGGDVGEMRIQLQGRGRGGDDVYTVIRGARVRPDTLDAGN